LRSSPAGVVLIKTLVERKRSRRFAAADRLIGDYKIKDVNGELRLWAEARSPYPESAYARVSLAEFSGVWAYTPILEGRRRWPRHLDVATFFWQTLRSLVSDAAKGQRRARQRMNVLVASEVPVDDSDDLDDPTDVVENYPGDTPTPEQEVFEATARESFLASLGDPITQDVAEWLLAGYKKDEITQDLGLDETAYDTHTKRIRRAAARLGGT